MAQTLEAMFDHGDDQERIDHTPTTAMSNGEIRDLGNQLVGICTSPEGIAADTLGSVATAGVFRIKKDNTDTFALGVKVAWDDTNNQAEPDGGANDDFTIGVCVEAAIAADDFVKVRVNQTNPS